MFIKKPKQQQQNNTTMHSDLKICGKQSTVFSLKNSLVLKHSNDFWHSLTWLEVHENSPHFWGVKPSVIYYSVIYAFNEECIVYE